MPWMMQQGQFGWWESPFLVHWMPFFGVGLFSLLLWTLVWKGWALWLAARRGEKIWFIVFLLINTLGILEIIYIFFIAKRSEVREAQVSQKPQESNTHGAN